MSLDPLGLSLVHNFIFTKTTIKLHIYQSIYYAIIAGNLWILEFFSKGDFVRALNLASSSALTNDPVIHALSSLANDYSKSLSNELIKANLAQNITRIFSDECASRNSNLEFHKDYNKERNELHDSEECNEISNHSFKNTNVVNSKNTQTIMELDASTVQFLQTKVLKTRSLSS